MLNTIVLSDLHIGSNVCNSDLLSEFLSSLDCKKLILNGDVLDRSDIRLNKPSWKILSRLRKLSEKGTEIVWVAGNHDHDAEVVAHLIGAEFVTEYEQDGILFIHGDEFDEYITKRKMLTWIADRIYSVVQKLNREWAVRLKLRSKIFLHNTQKVREGALDKMHKSGCNQVVCGHTHHAQASFPYYNSGCWTDEAGTYLEIDRDDFNLITLKVKR